MVISWDNPVHKYMVTSWDTPVHLASVYIMRYSSPFGIGLYHEILQSIWHRSISWDTPVHLASVYIMRYCSPFGIGLHHEILQSIWHRSISWDTAVHLASVYIMRYCSPFGIGLYHEILQSIWHRSISWDTAVHLASVYIMRYSSPFGIGLWSYDEILQSIWHRSISWDTPVHLTSVYGHIMRYSSIWHRSMVTSWDTAVHLASVYGHIMRYCSPFGIGLWSISWDTAVHLASVYIMRYSSIWHRSMVTSWDTPVHLASVYGHIMRYSSPFGIGLYHEILVHLASVYIMRYSSPFGIGLYHEILQSIWHRSISWDTPVHLASVLYGYGIVFRAVCVFTGTSHLIPPVSRSDEGGIWWRVTVKRIPHEEQYHVHFLARYDSIGLNTNILQYYYYKLSVGCVRKPNWNDTCRYFKNVRYAFLPELFVALRHSPSVREMLLFHCIPCCLYPIQGKQITPNQPLVRCAFFLAPPWNCNHLWVTKCWLNHY